MISNQRGSTAEEAPSYGVTWGGVPFNARRAMTVAAATLVVAGLAGPTTAFAATTTSASTAADVSVIVRETPGSGKLPEQAVRALGGSIGRQLSVIGGFTADVPADRLDALRAVPGVESVSEDASLTLNGLTDGGLLSTVTKTTTAVTAPVTTATTAVTEPVADATTAVTAPVADATTAVTAPVADATTAVTDTTTAVADTAAAVVNDVTGQADQAGSMYTITNTLTGASTMWDAGYTGKGIDVGVIDSGTVP